MSQESPEPIIIVEYDPHWQSMFESEKKLLQHTFDPSAEIEHIGSTAVPGLAAKPIIDIQILVDNLDEPSNYAAQLEKLGYKYKPEAFDSDHLFFWKGSPRTHHLHILKKGSKKAKQHLAFRDYLRANERGVLEYQNLKRAMAEKFRDDRSAYVDAKTAFVAFALAFTGPIE